MVDIRWGTETGQWCQGLAEAAAEGRTGAPWLSTYVPHSRHLNQNETDRDGQTVAGKAFMQRGGAMVGGHKGKTSTILNDNAHTDGKEGAAPRAAKSSHKPSSPY